MVLCLEDQQLQASVRRQPSRRYKLTLEYPAQPEYWDQVFAALGTLLRPCHKGQQDDQEPGSDEV